MQRTVWIGAACCAALAAAGFAATELRRREIRYVPAGDGAHMYQEYCAACHGADVRGRGPAAPALKSPATNLAILARENRGVFPALRVMTALTNPGTGGAHGSADMPVWGELFRTAGQPAAVVHVRIYNLVQFLEAIQDPSPALDSRSRTARPAPVKSMAAAEIDPTSGAVMYRAFCASCHGADGRGFGPASKAIVRQLPDLTVLTRTHGGKFPSAHIADVLNVRGVNVTAHGSADMPVWGSVLRGGGDSEARVRLRIANVTDYLKSIQQ